MKAQVLNLRKKPQERHKREPFAMIQNTIITNQDQNKRNLVHANDQLPRTLFSFRSGTSFKVPTFYLMHLEVFNNMEVNSSGGSREI